MPNTYKVNRFNMPLMQVIGRLEGFEIVEGKPKQPEAEFAFEEGDDGVESNLRPTEALEENLANQQATEALDSKPSDSFPLTVDGIRDAWFAAIRAKTESDFWKSWEDLYATFPEQTG
ncbi:hypothetical protein E4U61_004510 [Claviceps capensis]|nr:hypothetical protein E4U61_004510 [Claviceps capensis]